MGQRLDDGETEDSTEQAGTEGEASFETQVNVRGA